MHPVIILWAHPRSMSTAIERVMRERGDFDCLHEPFLHYYYIERSAKPLPHFDTEQDHPSSYAETRDMILRHHHPFYERLRAHSVTREQDGS